MKKCFIAYLTAFALILGSTLSCKGKKKMGKEDIEHAIMMLEDRRAAESRVVEEQNVIRKQLEENFKAANSDGMRNKIQKEIRMIDLSIEKARINMANQDTILFQLNMKRDSILKFENASTK